MERKIGEVFEDGGKKYKVMEKCSSETCMDICAFGDRVDCYTESRGPCTGIHREDDKYVYFAEVKE